MNPQIIDYYNEIPHEVSVIDKMNEELDKVQKENDNLKKKLGEYDKIMKKFQMPRIKVVSVGEYQLFETKLQDLQDFIKSESSICKLSWHYSNYGLSDDTMLGPGCIEDTEGFVYKLINKLDELTNHKNKEWCEYRILTSIEMLLKIASEVEETLSDIIFNSDEDQLPSTYRELSNLFIPEWSDRHENHNIFNIPYYNCEKCGKLDDYGETEIYGGLFCTSCN